MINKQESPCDLSVGVCQENNSNISNRDKRKM